MALLLSFYVSLPLQTTDHITKQGWGWEVGMGMWGMGGGGWGVGEGEGGAEETIRREQQQMRQLVHTLLVGFLWSSFGCLDHRPHYKEIGYVPDVSSAVALS